MSEPVTTTEKSNLVRLHEAALEYFQSDSKSNLTVETVAARYHVDPYEVQMIVHVMNKDFLSELRRRAGA